VRFFAGMSRVQVGITLTCASLLLLLALWLLALATGLVPVAG
jgi:hypothetical protein